MKVNGTAVLHATPDTVFAALNDPAVLTATIPGCDSLTPLGDDRYAMVVTAGVAAIKGTYSGEVALTDQQAPSSFVLRAKGSGAPGTVDTTVVVTLVEQDGGTLLTYAADAAVGGMVGGVGQRMLSGVAKKMAGQFFSAVDDHLTGRVPASTSAAQQPPVGTEPALDQAASQTANQAASRTSAQVAPQVLAPRSKHDDLRVPFYVMLAGVGAGAFCTLTGVVVGWVIARSRGADGSRR